MIRRRLSFLALLAVALAGAILFPRVAFASGTLSINPVLVEATNVNTCTINASYNLAFGDAPLGVATILSGGPVTLMNITCTAGDLVVLSSNLGLNPNGTSNPQLANGTHLWGYGVCASSSDGVPQNLGVGTYAMHVTGTGSPQNVQVYYKTLSTGTNVSVWPAGTYTDSLIFTLNY